MYKRQIILFIAVTGFVFVTAGACFADTATDLKQADVYLDSGHYSQAEGLCNSIVQNNPGSDYALKAQGKLAAIYIMTGRMADANALVYGMINSFRTNTELSAILYGIVQRYKQSREFQRAENLSQRVCQEFGGSEQAQRIQLDTGKELALKLITDSKYAQAEEAVHNMVSGAGNNPAVPATLFKIAKEFKEVGRFDETGRIYQRIAQNYPSSEFAGKARMGVDKLHIWNLITAGDVNSAQAATEQLISDYNSNGDLAHTVHGIALKFEEDGFYSQAKAWYNRVKTTWPDDRMAEAATVDLKKCDVRALVGNSSHSVVMQKVNELMADFPGHWHLPKAVWQIGTEYYNRALKLERQDSAEQAREYYGNAAAVWEVVINTLPNSASTPEACDYAAICYGKRGEYDKANVCYQKAIDSNKGYRMRWNMIYMAGRNYEKMKQAGVLSAEQADAQARAMYEKLLAEYPDCKAADNARRWLGQ